MYHSSQNRSQSQVKPDVILLILWTSFSFDVFVRELHLIAFKFPQNYLFLTVYYGTMLVLISFLPFIKIEGLDTRQITQAAINE